jgi:agmatine deiminase
MRPFVGLFLVFCITACVDTSKPSRPDAKSPLQGLRRPAEFEPCAAVWLHWPHYDHRQGISNEKASLAIIEALLPFVQVRVVVPSDSVGMAVRAHFPEKTGLATVTLPYREFWARDMGAAFAIDAQGRLCLTDFGFNAWGYAPEGDSLANLDEKLDERVAASQQFAMRSSDLRTEGGDHEVNGKGTIILTEAVECTRNPTMTKTQIEAEFARMLGIKKVIWLKQGLREDDYTFSGPMKDANGRSVYTLLTTNGHTDEFVRFVSPTKVLLAQADANATDPIEKENARRLEESCQILKNATDQDGKPLEIVRMPLPYPIVEALRPGDPVYDMISEMNYTDGSKFPKGKPVLGMAAASYLNFTIANGCVVMPKYWRPGQPEAVRQRDAEAQQIVQAAFPDKKIIALDVLAVNWGGGGIHCITNNQPVVK